MLIELRCNVMAKDFFNYIDKKRLRVYMNENTLYKLINQIRIYNNWGEDAVTTDEYIECVKSGTICALGDYTIVKYDSNVPDGYMRVEER